MVVAVVTFRAEAFDRVSAFTNQATGEVSYRIEAAGGLTLVMSAAALAGLMDQVNEVNNQLIDQQIDEMAKGVRS